MSKLRILVAAFVACAVSVAVANVGMIARLSALGAKMANPITGEGLPNPAPKVTRNWGELPAGRKWGTSAGVDIDPKDGHVWAYERCGAGTAGEPADTERGDHGERNEGNNPADQFSLGLIDVVYEPLPVVTDLATALAPGTPRVHADVPDNRAARFRQTVGDADSALARAPRVIRERLAI